MKHASADWLPYSLPLKQPWQTSRGTVTQREGQLFRLRDNDGRVGWGDSAPWPAFGISQAAADDFAEECAVLDLAAQRAGLPLNAWLSGDAPRREIAVNGMLGPLLQVSPASIQEALLAGFKIVKIKVGNAPLNDEIRHLEQIGRALPAGIRLRFDANGAWSMPEAQQFLAACADLPVEGLEEPLHQPTLGELAKLQEQVDYPLAIDESWHLIDRHFFNSPAVRRLIIKPPRHGSLLGSTEIALRARSAGVECIFTSSLESTCGLLAVAQLAAATAPEAVHGLATAGLFASDTGITPEIRWGKLQLPEVDGLGFAFQPA